jgi:toxin ParE1/3/4
MKKRAVIYRQRARTDIISLYRYIARESSPEIAFGYIQRIEKTCFSLAHFPERGSAIRGQSAGLRKMGFEHRVTILFKVGEERVEILRILYGGRNLEPVIEKL